MIGSLDVGGTEKHLSLILPRLLRPAFQPVVITLTHKGVLAEKLEKEGIKVYQPSSWVRTMQRIPVLSRLLGPLATIFYLVNIYMKVPARLTCLYLPASYHLGTIAALLTGARNKTVMFRRSLNNYQEKRPVISLIERYWHKRQLAIVGNSKMIIKELIEEEGAPKDRVTLIYNGIDVSRFKVESSRQSIRQELRVGENDIVLCIVANLIPYKGHADLVDALFGIADKISQPWTLLCVGAGIESRQDLIDKVKTHGLEDHVRWLGRRNDIPGILSASDIGLLASHQEGFSNSILEGMAAGLPMIVTDVGGNREAIEDGKCGLLVRPHDPEGLGVAILQLMNDMNTARQYGTAARMKVESCFSIERCVKNYESFFQAVTN